MWPLFCTLPFITMTEYESRCYNHLKRALELVYEDYLAYKTERYSNGSMVGVYKSFVYNRLQSYAELYGHYSQYPKVVERFPCVKVSTSFRGQTTLYFNIFDVVL